MLIELSSSPSCHWLRSVTYYFSSPFYFTCGETECQEGFRAVAKVTDLVSSGAHISPA